LKVSLVIPIYNEASHLQEFLQNIDTLDLPCEKELVFIDDCSKDESFKILSDFSFKSSTNIFRFSKNAGKGAALRKGFQLATGEIIGVQDADFEYSMDDIAELIKPLMQGKADVVYGSRFKKNATQVHRTFHYLINRFLTLVSNMSSGLYLTDMETCYKFFRQEIIKNIELESNRFGFEPEITAKIARLKVRVMELPISYFPRTYLEGKKITWKDGVAALRHIFYFNFFCDSKKYILSTMPGKYIPRGRQLL
jgi:glycosyltransferase involved in cell wall biosynthesis